MSDDWIEILDCPLDLAPAMEFLMGGRAVPALLIGNQRRDAAATVGFLRDARAGAIDIFLGTTRAERNSAGVELVALDYEAYQPMALDQFRRIAHESRDRWPVLKLVILHRVGLVPLGQASVLIGVATAHREAAFAACRFVIDALKAHAPIWKKEIWADGSASWSPGDSSSCPHPL